MIFVTGPLFAGKKNYIKERLGMSPEEFKRNAVWDVQDLAAGKETDEIERLADELSKKTIVIATEIGGGVVPVNIKERYDREAAGRLSILLAQRADIVIRVVCGIGRVIKGDADKI